MTQGGGDPACQDGCGKLFFIIRGTNSPGDVYLFKGPPADSFRPSGDLVELGGVLYGASYYGGSENLGTIFAVNLTTGKENVVHNFTGGSDGYVPNGDLIVVDGLLYGTTGTDNPPGGTVFSLNPATGVKTILHTFSGPDGSNPTAGLLNVGGTLYGTTADGGKYGFGTVFSLSLKNNAEKVLYSFKGGSDGAYPLSRLINVGGVLYSTTELGGGVSNMCSEGCGTVFSINPKTGGEKIVVSLQADVDGGFPDFGALLYSGGKLYGTTGGGLDVGNPYGTVFQVYPATGKEIVVHSFSSKPDGSYPFFGLTGAGGHLYGATSQGGKYGNGTVFEITP